MGLAVFLITLKVALAARIRASFHSAGVRAEIDSGRGRFRAATRLPAVSDGKPAFERLRPGQAAGRYPSGVISSSVVACATQRNAEEPDGRDTRAQYGCT